MAGQAVRSASPLAVLARSGGAGFASWVAAEAAVRIVVAAAGVVLVAGALWLWSFVPAWYWLFAHVASRGETALLTASDVELLRAWRPSLVQAVAVSMVVGVVVLGLLVAGLRGLRGLLDPRAVADVHRQRAARLAADERFEQDRAERMEQARVVGDEVALPAASLAERDDEKPTPWLAWGLTAAGGLCGLLWAVDEQIVPWGEGTVGLRIFGAVGLVVMVLAGLLAGVLFGLLSGLVWSFPVRRAQQLAADVLLGRVKRAPLKTQARADGGPLDAAKPPAGEV